MSPNTQHIITCIACAILALIMPIGDPRKRNHTTLLQIIRKIITKIRKNQP